MSTLTLRDPAFIASLSVGGGGPWTPAAITTALWFDANDATTITTVGSKVSEWRDKSGNTRHVSQSADAKQPTLTAVGQNGLSELLFSGSQFLERTQTDISAQWTCVIAARNGTVSSTLTMVGLGSTTTNARWRLERAGTNAQMLRRNDAGTSAAATQGTHTVSAFIQSGTCDGSLLGVSRNGAALTTASAPSGVFTMNRLTIGGIYTGTSIPTGFYNGAIFEFIHAPSMLSTLDRERLEGYLAHKWGLTGVLPAGHTFKSSAPTL